MRTRKKGLTSAAVVLLVLGGIVASGVISGLAVYYDSQNRPAVYLTQIVTTTSTNTVIQVVTRTPIESAPASISVFGTIESETNYPVAIDFCALSAPSTVAFSNSSQGAEIIGVTCGKYSTSVTNQTSQSVGPNIVDFLGRYHATLPNNETYLLQVRLLQSRSGPGFEVQAGWLPLNYTVSSQIGSYGIGCFNIDENGTITFQCSSGFG
jgi:hypothetical protein